MSNQRGLNKAGKWSKLQKALYNIVDPDMKFQMQCSVFWTRSSWMAKKGKGREFVPRYLITIGKNIVWDFPNMFINNDSQIDMNHTYTKVVKPNKPFSIKDTYGWSENYTWIAETIRAYIDTPKDQLLTIQFEKDKYGLVDVLRAVDRRIGKEKRKPYIEQISKECFLLDTAGATQIIKQAGFESHWFVSGLNEFCDDNKKHSRQTKVFFTRKQINDISENDAPDIRILMIEDCDEWLENETQKKSSVLTMGCVGKDWQGSDIPTEEINIMNMTREEIITIAVNYIQKAEMSYKQSST